MPAIKLRCEGPRCGRLYWASRKDAKYCSQKCRRDARAEDAKFKGPILKSGVKGVTWNRIIDRWTVHLQGKYLGSFKSVEEAVRFRQAVGDLEPAR